MAPDREELRRVVEEEQLATEPPVYPRVAIRGPMAVLWWGLRVYVLVMATLMVIGFLRGLH